MQKLCTNYAKIMQKLRKNYAKKLRKNYAYVCKLHNLHYYAPPTLLMLCLLMTTKLWTVFEILCHLRRLIHFFSEIIFRKAKAFLEIIGSSISK